MRLQPNHTVFLGFALFVAGLFVALMLVHGQPPAPRAIPF
jgi:hypothetical protein